MRVCYLFLLLAAAACTQSPARVEDKGKGRYGQSGYSDNRQKLDGMIVPPPEEPARQAEPAVAGSITSSDLPPPPKAENKPAEPPKLTTETKTFPAAEPAKPVAAPRAEAGSFAWPTGSRDISSAYNASTNGISIATGSGEPVYASADGEVIYVGNGVKSLATTVIIKHLGGRTTTYANLGQAKVEKYDRVKQGDTVGFTGKEELFFSVHDGKQSLDPKPLLKN